MFSLQEYQHVHLLWFKKRSFTLVWKPNPPLRSVRCVHLHARANAASESAAPALHTRRFCAASALLTRAVWTQALMKHSRWKRLSSLVSEIFLLQQADHALAQVRPRQIFTRTLSKNGRKCDHFGRSLEPCSVYGRNGKFDIVLSSDCWFLQCRL